MEKNLKYIYSPANTVCQFQTNVLANEIASLYFDLDSVSASENYCYKISVSGSNSISVTMTYIGNRQIRLDGVLIFSGTTRTATLTLDLIDGINSLNIGLYCKFNGSSIDLNFGGIYTFQYAWNRVVGLGKDVSFEFGNIASGCKGLNLYKITFLSVNEEAYTLYPYIETTTNIIYLRDADSTVVRNMTNAVVGAYLEMAFSVQPQSQIALPNETLNVLFFQTESYTECTWKRSTNGEQWTDVGTSSMYQPIDTSVGTYYYKCNVLGDFLGRTYSTDTGIATIKITNTVFDIDTLVYDRTQADVDSINEIAGRIKNGTASASDYAEWNSFTSKGKYNYTDLNRVGMGMLYDKQLCSTVAISVNYPFPIKLDFDNTYAPLTSDVSNIISNIQTLKNKLSLWIDTPSPTALASLDDANNIEYILYQVEGIVNLIKATNRYSAEIYCGEQY